MKPTMFKTTVIFIALTLIAFIMANIGLSIYPPVLGQVVIYVFLFIAIVTFAATIFGNKYVK